MIQRIVQVLLLITLVGQNFLSPALATHDMMHTLKNIAGETILISLAASSDTLEISTALNPSLADFSAFNCADVCIMLASGHCVNHCASLTGIFIEPALTKYRPSRSPQNNVTLWSAQTADALPINRPPIV